MSNLLLDRYPLREFCFARYCNHIRLLVYLKVPVIPFAPFFSRYSWDAHAVPFGSQMFFDPPKIAPDQHPQCNAIGALHGCIYIFAGPFCNMKFSWREKHGTDVSKMVKKYTVYCFWCLFPAVKIIVVQSYHPLSIKKIKIWTLPSQVLRHFVAKNFGMLSLCVIYLEFQYASKHLHVLWDLTGEHIQMDVWPLSNKHQWKASDSWVEGGIAPKNIFDTPCGQNHIETLLKSESNRDFII